LSVNGLVAPPWALNTGSMFGKGIYFADMFDKSWGYTTDWSLFFNRYTGLYQQNYQKKLKNQDKEE
jgi:hypothetical protein